jgi:hypothetical protein
MHCNQCGSDLPDNARFCQQCGTKVVHREAVASQVASPPVDASGGEEQSASSSRPPATTWQCPACRQLNRPGSEVCSCGWAFSSAADTAAPASSPTSGPSSIKHNSVGIDPFLSLWLQPRATIRKIVDSDPSKHVFWLVCVAAFFNCLNQASARSIGDQVPTGALILIGAVLSPLAIPLVYLGAMLGKWTGSKLGGVATREQVRAALAWSGVPVIAWSLLAWPLQLIMFGDEVFQSTTPRMETTGPTVLFGFLLAGVVALIWSSVVGIKCFAEVHRFSAWRAIGASLLGLAVVFGPVIALILVAVAIGSLV